MTGPGLGVDTAALEAVARKFAQLSEELTRSGTVHEAMPATDQPSGKAVSELTAADLNSYSDTNWHHDK